METVKEKLTKLIEQAERKNQDCGIFPYILAEELAQNGVTIQEWVSVDEPPKKYGKYLVTCEGIDIPQIRQFDGKWDSLNKVIAWQPLPPIAKGVQ